MKKLFVNVLCFVIAMSLCACGASPVITNDSGAATVTESNTEKTDGENQGVTEKENSEIDFTLDEGNIKFVKFVKAAPELTDQENALVFIFEYTNYQDRPSNVQSTFWIRCFQNGAELNDSVSYSGAAKEQYDLIQSFFSEALKGGTVTFGKLVYPKDNSPITVMVEKQGSKDEYQMMEVDISAPSSEKKNSGTTGETQGSADADVVTDVSAEEVDELLQGTWELPNGKFVFRHGNVIIYPTDAVLAGTYEINTGDSAVVVTVKASDGDVKMTLPFEYSNGALTLRNNRGVELTKVE